MNFHINSGLNSPPFCRLAADRDKVFASLVQLSLSRIYSSVLHCSSVKSFGVRGQPKATSVMTELVAVANLVRGRDRCGAPELPRNGASGLPYSRKRSARLVVALVGLASWLSLPLTTSAPADRYHYHLRIYVLHYPARLKKSPKESRESIVTDSNIISATTTRCSRSSPKRSWRNRRRPTRKSSTTSARCSGLARLEKSWYV